MHSPPQSGGHSRRPRSSVARRCRSGPPRSSSHSRGASRAYLLGSPTASLHARLASLAAAADPEPCPWRRRRWRVRSAHRLRAPRRRGRARGERRRGSDVDETSSRCERRWAQELGVAPDWSVAHSRTTPSRRRCGRHRPQREDPQSRRGALRQVRTRTKSSEPGAGLPTP